MDKNKRLIKITSVSKKILVAVVGGFLLIFLLFHMAANLCILRNDMGVWYADFCHFMGTNYIVKVMEIVLLGSFGIHICLTVALWICNRKSRPVRYRQPSQSKTSRGSKIMIVSGALMIVCLILHFMDFFMVKLGVENDFSQYMVNIEDLTEESVNVIKDEAKYAIASGYFKDGTRVRGLNSAGKAVLKSYGIKAEPDFYYMAREIFSDPYISIMYLLFFAVVGFHCRHAFASAFQTLGLSNYKYSRLIEIVGIVYTWIICLGFSIVPIGVLFLV